MPGINHARTSGRKGHPSRNGYEGSITWPERGDLEYELSLIIKTILKNDPLYRLVIAIGVAKAENESHKHEPTRQDTLAQLRWMAKLDDTGLKSAIRQCDLWTFRVVDAVQIEISNQIHGDHRDYADPDCYLSGYFAYPPPAKAEAAADKDLPWEVYLPTGIDGLRRSVEIALDRQAAQKSKNHAGRKPNRYQIDLAKACADFYFAHHKTGAAWKWADKQFPLFMVGDAVFKAAKMDIQDDRLAKIFRAITPYIKSRCR
jgi:hypothetical protein